ncbi:MAG TPA: zinc ribbon domain-containing protein [Blastocatellia bacterium]|nr:zinc ribbon domain-containing protein [Blastocatellia bacterium]
MYCPTCGTQTTDNATFCRSCGANLSLVSQALTGSLVPANVASVDGRYLPDGPRDTGAEGKKPRTMSQAISQFSSGLGFVAVALCTLFFAPAGRLWWYWMLIPAFSLWGSAVSIAVELRMEQRRRIARQPAVAPPPNGGELTARQAYGINPPPSVVEATTRQLDTSRNRSE